jgi:hypothetical protein
MNEYAIGRGMTVTHESDWRQSEEDEEEDEWEQEERNRRRIRMQEEDKEREQRRPPPILNIFETPPQSPSYLPLARLQAP